MIELEQENEQLRMQNEAITNAAQVIGSSFQGRLRDVESKHEAQLLKDRSGKNKSDDKKDKHKKKEKLVYRDIAMFLAGALMASSFIAAVSLFTQRRSSLVS